MTKKIITQLVQASYTKGILDSTKVEKIVSLLSRHDLKQYVRGLKLSEKARTISLVLPNATLYNTNKKILDDTFEDKRIIVEEDPTLLLGMKVIDNDMEYDFTLKNNLKEFTRQVSE